MAKALRNYIFGRHRDNPVARVIARRAEKIVLAYKNFNYDMHSNGEEYLLRDILAGRDPQVIVDVGANDGEWAIVCARYCKQAQIHAFEIVPSTADICARAIADEMRITLHRTGLGDSNGVIQVHTYEGLSTHSSILDLRHSDKSSLVECPILRGDDFVTRHNIAQIDFLKIDVEGAENRVMAGFAQTLQQRKIKMIQFEYGRANILSKFLLKDWYDLLTPLGYRIGKLYPQHIDFKDYDLKDEDFIGPNYVAVLD